MHHHTPSHFILDEDGDIVDWAESPRAAQSLVDALNKKTLREHTIVHKDDLTVDLRKVVDHLQRNAR